MNELLNLLKDGHARTTLMLASELHTTPADIRRKLEFLENAGIIKGAYEYGRNVGSGALKYSRQGTVIFDGTMVQAFKI